MSDTTPPSHSGLTQTTYRETAYEDSSWEIVGEHLNQESFEPLEFSVLPGVDAHVDPMFADYGGLPSDKSSKRFHLAQGETFEASRAAAEEDLVGQHAAQQQSQQNELNRLVAEALEQGRQEGAAAITAESEAQIKALTDQFEGLLTDLSTQLAEHKQSVENQALQLSLQIAEKLIGAAVEINPEYVLKIIQEGLSQVSGAVIKCVKVSPQDYEFLKLVSIPNYIKDYDSSWSFESDDSIKAGCIVVTSAGEVDYQLDKSFERVREQIMKIK